MSVHTAHKSVSRLEMLSLSSVGALRSALEDGIMIKCDCCNEQVRQVNEIGLCFSCGLVQAFATHIEEQTELSDDAAVDLAADLVSLVRSRILERGMDAPKEAWAGFFEDVGRGMVRVSRAH